MQKGGQEAIEERLKHKHKVEPDGNFERGHRGVDAEEEGAVVLDDRADPQNGQQAGMILYFSPGILKCLASIAKGLG